MSLPTGRSLIYDPLKPSSSPKAPGAKDSVIAETPATAAHEFRLRETAKQAAQRLAVAVADFLLLAPRQAGLRSWAFSVFRVGIGPASMK